MDLAALKNLDVKDLLEKIKGGGGADLLKNKKLLIKLGIIGGSILLLLIIHSFFIAPIVDEQKVQINIMNENQTKTQEYLNNITELENTVKKMEPKYKKSSKMFHSKQEIEGLYSIISKFASMNGLSITSIDTGEPKAVGQNENSTEQTENAENNPAVLYYTIPVNYKINGSYLGYLKFRRALSKSNKVINFDKEIITVDVASGKILSEGTISIVGLPNEYKN
jgi:Tfp pilus assembly protein PilO